MARNNRKSEKQVVEDVPPAAPPPLVTPSERRFRGTPSVVAYLALALIVVLAVVFGGRWIYNQTRDTEEEKPAPTTEPAPQPAQPQPPSDNQGAQQPPAGTQPSDELANTGPGETAAIAIGTAIAVAGLHYIISLRRSS